MLPNRAAASVSDQNPPTMELISEFIPALQPSVYFEAPSHQGQLSATQSPTPSTLLEIAALILLVIGAIILPVIGRFIGVIVLWSSRIWTTGGKLAGTLLFPGGLHLPAVLVIVPIAMVVVLARRMRLRPRQVGQSAGGGPVRGRPKRYYTRVWITLPAASPRLR